MYYKMHSFPSICLRMCFDSENASLNTEEKYLYQNQHTGVPYNIVAYI